MIDTTKARAELASFHGMSDYNADDLLNEIDRLRNAITEYIVEVDCPAPDMNERVRLRQRLREIAEEKP